MPRIDSRLCHEEEGECFAQVRDKKCGLLSETYAPGKCPFKKEYKDITDGKEYPFDPLYGTTLKKEVSV